MMVADATDIALIYAFDYAWVNLTALSYAHDIIDTIFSNLLHILKTSIAYRATLL